MLFLVLVSVVAPVQPVRTQIHYFMHVLFLRLDHHLRDSRRMVEAKSSWFKTCLNVKLQRHLVIHTLGARLV